MTHSPTPWYGQQKLPRSIFGSDNYSVATTASKDDMEHIIKCVNAHHDLVTALKDIGFLITGDSETTVHIRKIVKSTLAKHGLLCE